MGGRHRKTCFTPEKLMEVAGAQHQEAFGTDPPKAGYPDCGNGRYAEGLNREDWF